MKIVVIGGSGLIGKKLVPTSASAATRRCRRPRRRASTPSPARGWPRRWPARQVVVDVANSPSLADEAVMEFFETSTRNLLAAEAAAGVGHHVALSVVGADRMPDSGYMRAKVAQEKLIEAGGVPYTIVRATQFFEFLGGIAGSGADGDTVRLPTAPMQPLAADDVAAALADVAVGPPVNGMVELAGPESLSDRRVRGAVPGRERGHPNGGRGPAGPLLRRGAGRPRPRTRERTRASARRGSRTGSPAHGAAIVAPVR